MRKVLMVGMVLLATLLSGCGYNTLQREDEAVKGAWSEVLNQYQRRFDLIPNLVNTVKGFTEQEKDVLLGVANARASVGAIKATPELCKDPLYLREERTNNLLRWDLEIDPEMRGEKAKKIQYDFQLELDRQATLGSFQTK